MEGKDGTTVIYQVVGQGTYRALEESVHQYLKHMEGRKRWTDYLATITASQLHKIGLPGRVALIDIDTGGTGEVNGHLIGDISSDLGTAWIHQWYSHTNDREVADRLFNEFVELAKREGVARVQGFSIRRGIRRRLSMKPIGTIWERKIS